MDFDSLWAFSCLTRLYVCYSLGVWVMLLNLLISLDRFLKRMYPNRFGSMRKWQTQSIFVVLMLFYSFAVNIILPVNTSYKIQNPKSVCILPFNAMFLHSWIFVAHILFLIFCFNNAVNIRLIIFIFSSRSRVTNLGNSSSTHRNLSSRDRKFAITSIRISFIALLSLLPLGFWA